VVYLTDNKLDWKNDLISAGKGNYKQEISFFSEMMCRYDVGIDIRFIRLFSHNITVVKNDYI